MAEEQDSWDDHAEGWDDNAAVVLYADKAFSALSEHVVPLLTSLPDCRVLDFGCGTGLLTAKLAPLCASVLAVDASPKMIAVFDRKLEQQRLPNVAAMVCNLEQEGSERVTAGREPFDLIVASSVCAFLSDYEQTLAALARMLNPGGVFVQWDWQVAAGDSSFGLSGERIFAAHEAAGLEVLRVEPAFQMEADGETMTVLMGIGQRR